MALVAFILGAIVWILVLLLALENTEAVTLRFLFTWQTPPISLLSVIMASVGVGFVIAGLFGLAAYARGRRTIHHQRRQIADLQAELHRLRMLPLDTPLGAHGAMHQTKPDVPASELSPP
ncbi:MAG TPA: LapA family protein [Alphaproteobacteria bacterium]|nr:LapA family protein [Alphaproteobacteria bacterium]